MSRGANTLARAWPAGALVLVLAVVALGWPVQKLALLGWDSYPLIEAGRVSNAAELWGTLGEELMDGGYPLGRFYRPLVHLSFALDHALWGLSPAGYHRTDLAILGSCALTLFLLARRWLGASAWPAALVAALVYVAHPVQFEILPVAARRAEALSVLFTLLALLWMPTTQGGKARRWAAGLACVLAVASKETGAVATLAVVCLAFATSPAKGFVARAREALRATWPALVLFAIFFAVRTAVLGGLGGSAESSLLANLPGLLPFTGDYVGGLLVPELGPGRARAAACVGAAATMLALVLVSSPARRDEIAIFDGAPQGELDPRRLLAVLVLWILAVAAVSSISGLVRGWYALPFLPPLALAAGLAVGLSARSLRAGRWALGVVALLVALAFAQPALRPRAATWSALRAASRDQAEFLGRFENAMLSALDGQVMQISGMPTERPAVPGDPNSLKLIMLAPYSLEAWARLRFPDRRLRFTLVGRELQPRAASDEVLIVLAP
jgi:hypothetical protein